MLVGLALAAMVIVPIVWFVPEEKGVGGRSFAGHRDDLAVLETSLVRASATNDFQLTGVVTNRSEYPWRVHELELRLLDAQGKLLDVRHHSVKEPFVVLPRHEHGFQAQIGELAFTNSNIGRQVRVQEAGQIVPNGAASSSAAEVCYFVRNGTLYRRVVLLRQPLSVVGNISTASSDTIQPKSAAAVPLAYFDPANGFYAGNYWNDFDIAAFRNAVGVTQLLGMDTNGSVLDNQRSAATDNPLGRSRRRFGFDQSTGLSREFFGASNELFLGRFTHQETSSAGFRFPFALSMVAPGGNPFATGAILPDANFDGVPDGLDTGSRVGEDILLTHVHSFEVEFFDERLQSFAPIGHSLTNPATGLAGDFHLGRRLDTVGSGYFPPGMGQTPGHVFDTWHPLYDQDGSPPADQLPANNLAAMAQDNPPYRPMAWDPMGVSAPMPTNTGSTPQWMPGVNYVPGDVVFPPTEDTNYNGMLDTGEDTNATTFKGYAFNSAPLPNGSGDNLIDVRQTIDRPVLPLGRVYYYICRRAAVPNPSNMNTVPAASTSYADQPAWTNNPSRLFGHNNNPERDFMPLWEAVPNLKPVRAVRITVRFLHRGSNKLRQFTLVHSLRD